MLRLKGTCWQYIFTHILAMRNGPLDHKEDTGKETHWGLSRAEMKGVGPTMQFSSFILQSRLCTFQTDSLAQDAVCHHEIDFL